MSFLLQHDIFHNFLPFRTTHWPNLWVDHANFRIQPALCLYPGICTKYEILAIQGLTTGTTCWSIVLIFLNSIWSMQWVIVFTFFVYLWWRWLSYKSRLSHNLCWGGHGVREGKNTDTYLKTTPKIHIWVIPFCTCTYKSCARNHLFHEV